MRRAHKQINEFGGKYRFLSNFYACAVMFEGVTYPSVENAYQAAKTLDQEDRQMFYSCTAGQAKRWGSPTGRIKIQAGWDDKKIGVMTYLVRKKFAEYPFRLALLSTGDALLAEGNWWGDRFWGTVGGKGENYLGKILMQVRQEIRDEKVLGSEGVEKAVKRNVRKITSGTSDLRQKTKAAKA
jgi:ribA/ribD-fused uncharacterized protein